MRTRTVLWWLVLTGTWINNIILSNINIAIIGMVQEQSTALLINETVSECSAEQSFALNQTVSVELNDSASAVEDGTNSSVTIQRDDAHPRFDWTEQQQGLVLGSIYWLWGLTVLPGSILGNKYGPKLVFGLPHFICSLSFFALPYITYLSFSGLIALRALQGLVIGFSLPPLHTITSKWIPPDERGWFISSYMGGALSILVGYPFFGWLLTVSSWEMIFYVSGAVGVVWSLAWELLMFDTPEQHPRISVEELNYIQRSLRGTVHHARLATPWLSILGSLQVWLNLLGNTMYFVILCLSMMYFPSYLKTVHGMDVQTAALLSGLPQGLRLLLSILSAIVSDRLIRTRKTSRTAVRKVSTAAFTLIAGLLLIALGFTGCNTDLVVVLIFLVVATIGFTNCGVLAAMVDITPNFSGILLGFATILAAVAAGILPVYVGWLTDGNQSLAQWRKVFISIAAIGIAVGVAYLCLAKVEVQSWNQPKPESEKKTAINGSQKNGAPLCPEDNFEVEMEERKPLR